MIQFARPDGWLIEMHIEGIMCINCLQGPSNNETNGERIVQREGMMMNKDLFERNVLSFSFLKNCTYFQSHSNVIVKQTFKKPILACIISSLLLCPLYHNNVVYPSTWHSPNLGYHLLGLKSCMSHVTRVRSQTQEKWGFLDTVQDLLGSEILATNHARFGCCAFTQLTGMM